VKSNAGDNYLDKYRSQQTDIIRTVKSTHG
jgi:hypothetical protein